MIRISLRSIKMGFDLISFFLDFSIRRSLLYFFKSIFISFIYITWKIKFQRYVDKSKNVIYLHLESFNDCNDLMSLFEGKLSSQASAEEIDETELFELYQKEQTKFIRALLLIFSISHIIVVSNPTCSFDISYVRLFRIVDIFRNKMMPPLIDLIKSLGLPISKDWLYAARPCAPRVLFTFENCSLDLLNESSSDNNNKALEKLQHSLEDHIYQSMRKSYVITNIR